MNKPFLHPDDRPPTEVTQQDRMLHLELEQSIGSCFYQACDRITQVLLSQCQWYLITDANSMKLVIDCPDIVTYWHIVNNITQIGTKLEKYSSDAKIRVYPPSGKGMPFEISVNEISAYRDWL
ncbi:hypothetical protein QUB80_31415 [Chlorogloeopsis sp. ULAP01]|uniref:hypothetical protein n=1 Tax=Chlorogloeopsis sp. ULAP01 TaxID=3056483 RepID=UPI0025AABE93|nr:hypothetical protein [Chlorogloeopsis sp. ULAP01]MDM9385164.1 hypothetical protein [Chlorogloeopsis sp. ULAP01]